MIRRICLFGGPGCGKSTLAARLYTELKSQGQNIELVREYIKDWAYQKIVPQSFDQCYIFAKQMRAEDLLLRHVDYIVTDSPLTMQCAYVIKYQSPFLEELQSLCTKFEQRFPSLNLFLDRSKVPYRPHGRYENYGEALAVDQLIVDHLKSLSLPYDVVDATNHHAVAQLVADKVKE